MIPGLFGEVFAVLFTMIFAQPFGEVCLADYEPMRIKCHVDPIAAVLGIIVPTVMYIFAAIRSVNELLKKDTVLLLNGNSGCDGEPISVNKPVYQRQSFG